tara:strand:- start:1096 stop:1488 length:393 start_codon:yes stop_codon:yes gene_type:complete
MTEQDLFNYIKENYIIDLEKSSSKYAKTDCFSIEFNLDIELKCRRTHYETLLIEKKKYKALISRAIEFNTRPVYINSTPKGIWGFYLSNTDLQWETKLLPKNTDFGDREKIEKEIAYLNVVDGISLSCFN